MAISGNYALIGAPYDEDAGYNSGSAIVFERKSNGSWKQVAKLVADDGAAGDEFGFAVAISGAYAVVGAKGDDDAGGQGGSGSAYLFGRNADGAWSQVAKLVADDAAAGDYFGRAVGISGDYAVVAAYVRRRLSISARRRPF